MSVSFTTMYSELTKSLVPSRLKKYRTWSHFGCPSYLLVMLSGNSLLSESSTTLGPNLRKCHPRNGDSAQEFLTSSNTKIIPLRPLKHSQNYVSSASSLYFEFITINNDSFKSDQMKFIPREI